MALNSKQAEIAGDISNISNIVKNIVDEMSKVIVGNKTLIQNILAALFTQSHVMIEGLPGLGKTLIAKSISIVLNLKYNRIQCTADMLPSDIIGSFIYVPSKTDFKFMKGPIFANIVFIDEINRAPPKTQSAFLEAMQEGYVTVEGKTFELPKPFFVIATLNPIEVTGVFPLPEAQIDRFAMKLNVKYPSPEEELEIISGKGFERIGELKPVASPELILSIQGLVDKVYMDERIKKYIVDIVRATRNSKLLILGASPRAAITMARISKARALIFGRSYVIPDDVKAIIKPTLRHRIKIKPEVELEGIGVDGVIDRIVRGVKVP